MNDELATQVCIYIYTNGKSVNKQMWIKNVYIIFNVLVHHLHILHTVIINTYNFNDCKSYIIQLKIIQNTKKSFFTKLYNICIINM